ncbi:hypothetical protein FM106_04580 [Brachybacterium faecium]|nr:hypothetical protein FM106_04580 [Brachybacterium faecium]
MGRTTRGGLQGIPGGSAPFATPPGALRCRGPLPPLLHGKRHCVRSDGQIPLLPDS